MIPRIIFHVDMDAFFASVEILNNPELKGKAVIVGGDPTRRGVVSTCSYEARKFGVRSAMSLFEAKKRCPHGVFVVGNFEHYREYSSMVMKILLDYSPITEIVGIDEAYMDVSCIADKYKGSFNLGKAIRHNVLKSCGLTCSIGIGSNKLIAKIASSLGKPNGLYEIPQGLEIEFLAPLPIQNLPGIGQKTTVILNHHGYRIVKDLQNAGMEKLINDYGAHGYYYYLAAMGKDNRQVVIDDHIPKSIGAETTFDEDNNDLFFLNEELKLLFEKAYKRLRYHKMLARGISIKLRYADFHTISRCQTFNTHTKDKDVLLEQLQNLFKKEYDGVNPLRLIGLSFEKLTNSYWQPTFWELFNP